jgi:diketogulonate reductase-like aldo/keto reductase
MVEGLAQRHERSPDTVNWRQEDAWVVDAVRGAVYRMKWRWTIAQYFQENPDHFRPMLDGVIRRLGEPSAISFDPSIQPPLWGPIGLGTYGWKYDPDVIKRAEILGIRLIDTAETYGYGRVEEKLGEVFEELAYTPLIATKFSRSHMSYAAVRNASVRSRRRLGLGKIDLYQAHWPSPKIRVGDTVRAMDELVKDGWVTWLGVSNHSVDQIVAVMTCLGRVIDAVQVRYNLQDRGVERLLLPWCKSMGIPVIAYSPLGQNFRKFLAADEHGVLDYAANRYGASQAQIALAWLLSKGVIPIPRTNKPDHVTEIVDSQHVRLSRGDVDVLDSAFPIGE